MQTNRKFLIVDTDIINWERVIYVRKVWVKDGGEPYYEYVAYFDGGQQLVLSEDDDIVEEFLKQIAINIREYIQL